MARIDREYMLKHEPALVEEFRAEGRQQAAGAKVAEEARIAPSLVQAIEARGARKAVEQTASAGADLAAMSPRLQRMRRKHE